MCHACGHDVHTTVVLGVLVALAIPALGMHTASAGVDSIPKDTPVIKTFNRITAAFPGEKASLNVVVKAKDVTGPEVAAGIKQLEARAAGSKTASTRRTSTSPRTRRSPRSRSRSPARAPTLRR